MMILTQYLSKEKLTNIAMTIQGRETITVRELIERLNQLDQSLKVFVNGNPMASITSQASGQLNLSSNDYHSCIPLQYKLRESN